MIVGVVRFEGGGKGGVALVGGGGICSVIFVFVFAMEEALSSVVFWTTWGIVWKILWFGRTIRVHARRRT